MNINANPIRSQFSDLKIGQKFEHSDYDDRILERVAGNAAGFIPHIGILATFEPNEVVSLVGEA